MATSPHFHDDELACGCSCGLNNVKPELLDKLERARALHGWPLIINSGSRCPEYNAEVGGAEHSAHLTGDAVDIHCPSDAERFKLVLTFIGLGINRIGLGSSFLHVDISTTLPQGVLWLYDAPQEPEA